MEEDEGLREGGLAIWAPSSCASDWIAWRVKYTVTWPHRHAAADSVIDVVSLDPCLASLFPQCDANAMRGRTKLKPLPKPPGAPGALEGLGGDRSQDVMPVPRRGARGSRSRGRLGGPHWRGAGRHQV